VKHTDSATADPAISAEVVVPAKRHPSADGGAVTTRLAAQPDEFSASEAADEKAPDIKSGDYRAHPAAALMPDPTAEEFARLVADIEKHGLRVPVKQMATPDGYMLLDGRSRARAWQMLGRNPEDLPMEVVEHEDPVLYVLSLNLARRHLTASQRAMIAAKIAKLSKGRPKNGLALPHLTTKAAAEKLKVSPELVKSAKKILKAVPAEVVKRVEAGELTVTEAARGGKKRTTQALPETESPVAKQDKAKAPANGQTAPKYHRGTAKWVEARVGDLEEVVRDLRSKAVSRLTRAQRMRITLVREVLQHVERIAANFVEVDEASLALVRLWNQQKAEQLEGEDFLRRTMPEVQEAIACEPNLDRWARVIEKIAGEDPSWFTLDNFDYLISTLAGRPDGLEDLEQQEGLPAWGSVASESLEEVAR
jgi:hypothetical protein